jgi:secreted trypsin-like serine protease
MVSQYINIQNYSPTNNIHLAASQKGKIIGGSVATAGQFPYQVGIFLDGTGFCGGSLIAPDVVLTAAHCAVE